MRKSIRTLAVGGALALAAGVGLAGCAGSDAPAEDKDEGDVTEVEGDATDGEAVELDFLTWLPTQVQWPELIEAFEEENPNITINFQRDEDYDAFRTNLDNEIIAGDTPDIYGIQAGSSFDDYAEYALPVDEYASDWIDGIQETLLDETTTAEGVLAAVPIITAGQEFYLYNKTLMDEHGLELPTTWDSLVEVSKAATDAGLSPFAMGAADAWHDVDFFIWLSNQYGDGGDIYKAADGEIPWDSEGLVHAAEMWQALFTDGVFQQGALTTDTYPQARDDYFLAGKSIAMPTGSWHVGMALVGPDQEQPGSAIEDDEVGMAVFPQIGPNNAGATIGVDFALALSDEIDDEKKEAAAKFVEFMAVGEGQQIWVNMLQGFPAAKDVDIHLDPSEPELAVESMDVVQEALAGAKYPRKISVPGWDSLEDDLGVVLQEIAGGADPASKLASLNR